MTHPSSWTQTNLGTLIELSTGKLDANAAVENGEYPFFTCSEKPSQINTYAFDTDAVLLAGNGSFGVKHYKGKFNAYQRTYVIEALGISSRFLFWLIKANIHLITENERGSTIPYIRKGDITDIDISLPPLNEQIRIADKLDSALAKVDAAQARLEKIPTLLKRFRQSVLAAATSGELTTEWRSKNSLPLNYGQISFDELLIELRNGLSPKPNEEGIGHPILRISSVRSGQVDQEDIRYLDCGDKELDRYKLRRGDLLFTRYNGSLEFVGVCGMIRDLRYENLLYPDKLIRARLNNQALPEYIEIYFSSSAVRESVKNCVKTTSGQKGISGTDIKFQVVLLPNLKEQKEIVRRVESLFTQADAVEKQYRAAKQRLDRLSQSLLAKAFRGELVSQDPNDEPATELLKRIQAERQQAADKPKRKTAKRDKQTNAVANQTKSNIMQLKDAPETYLLDLLNQLGGESHAEVLWKKSELAIDDFYAKLKQEMLSNRIVEDKNSPDPALRKLKVANR